MSEKLKNIFFTTESVYKFADHLKQAHPPFDKAQFLKLVFDSDWENRELKERMRHVTICVHDTLPADYPQALKILKQAAPGITGFDAMDFPILKKSTAWIFGSCRCRH